jgi:hypothetical protein
VHITHDDIELMSRGQRRQVDRASLKPRRVPSFWSGSAGQAGEEACDLMRCVPLQGVAADVVAGQGGLGTGVAEQALHVSQRNALVKPDRADRAPERVRPDGSADAGDLGGAGDVAVHQAAVHAGAGAGTQQRPADLAVDGRLHRRQSWQRSSGAVPDRFTRIGDRV